MIVSKASLRESFLPKSSLAADYFPHSSTQNTYLWRSPEFNLHTPFVVHRHLLASLQSPLFRVFPHTEHLQLSLHLMIIEVATYTQTPLTSLGSILSNPREFTDSTDCFQTLPECSEKHRTSSSIDSDLPS